MTYVSPARLDRHARADPSGDRASLRVASGVGAMPTGCLPPAKRWYHRLPLQDAQVRLTRSRGTWKIVAPAGAAVSEEVIDSFVKAVADAVVVEVVDENPGDLEQYGLVQPAMTISASTKDATYTLALGNPSPAGVSLYAKRTDQNRIILIGTYLRFSLKTFLAKVK